ncbi:MAG TPA: LacI family DNA-binding transcriptional regulator [Candidatus Dorea intestinavium]|nr:LacI family DNA-binding transcriptional regulator [Candidatus Dorea intestinavium]
MKISVRRISEITGYSPATVSNALNYKKGVNKKTAEKIRAVAKEEGYFNKQKIKKIHFAIFKRNGLIIDGSAFHPAVIEGVEKQAKLFGLETIYNYLDVKDKNFKNSVTEIIEDRGSAIVLLATEMQEEDFKWFLPAKERVILLDGWSEEESFDSVLINNMNSSYLATKYLINKGHKKIGYLQGDFRIQAFKDRELGVFQALKTKGLVLEEENIVTLGTKIESSFKTMNEYLNKSKTIPTAFFADNDIIAIGAIKALKKHGYQVPKDVSVVGFDDIEYCSVSEPPLTTIHVYKKELGELAVKLLVSKMEEERTICTRTEVCTDLVERGSVVEI